MGIASGSDEEQMDQPVRRKRRNTIASSSVSGDEADLPPPLGTERTLRKRSKWSGNVLSAMAGMRRRQGSPVKGSTVPASAACTGVCVADSALEGPTRQRDSCDDLGTTDKISATHASSEKLQFGTNTTARSNSSPPVTEKLAPAENDEEFKVISPAVGGHPELVPPSIVQLPARISCTVAPTKVPTSVEALDVPAVATSEQLPQLGDLTDDLLDANGRQSENDSVPSAQVLVPKVRREVPRLNPEQSNVTDTATEHLQTQMLDDRAQSQRHVTSEPPAEGILQSVVSSNFTVERTASPVESDTDRVDLEMRPAEKSDRPSGAVGSQLRSRFSSGPRMGKSKKWVPMEVPLAGEENLAPLGNKKCGHVRRMKPSEANSHWVCQDCGEMLIFDGWRREMGGASDMRL